MFGGVFWIRLFVVGELVLVLGVFDVVFVGMVEMVYMVLFFW